MNNHVYSIKQYLNRWNRVNKLNIQINYLSNLNFDDLALIFFEKSSFGQVVELLLYIFQVQFQNLQYQLKEEMIQAENLQQSEEIQESISKKLVLKSKAQKYKFFQHLSLHAQNTRLSHQAERKIGETNSQFQEQLQRELDSCQMSLRPTKSQNYYSIKEEYQAFQSQSSEKQHSRKKNIIQKNLSAFSPLDGQGIIKLEDGKVVFGKWKKGVFVGNAKIIYPSENIYVGEVKRYLREGKGLLIQRNGDRYVGNFHHDEYDGYGTKYDAQFQRISEGVWRKGVLTKEAN